MPSSEEAAAAAAAKMLGDEAAEEAEQQAEVEGKEEEETYEWPNLGEALPDELASELEEEPDFRFEEEELEVDPDDEIDPEVAKQLRKLEKERDHYKQLRLREGAKTWSQEATKFFPLSEPFLSTIKADSRRAYLKEAKSYHEALKPVVEEKVLKPARAAMEAERVKMREEEKEAARKTWGQGAPPPSGETQTPSEQAAIQERVTKARRTGEFSDIVKAMIFPKE